MPEPAGRQPSRFGVLLRRYRIAHGLTQEALAERAGMSARGVSDLERGVATVPREDTVVRLADALGLESAVRTEFIDITRDLRMPPSDRICTLRIASRQGNDVGDQRLKVANAVDTSPRPSPAAPPLLRRSRSVQSRGPTQLRLPIVGLAILLLLAAPVAAALVVSHGSSKFTSPPQYRVAAVWSDLSRAPGTFAAPLGIAVDREGNVYVADSGNARVQKLSPEGVVLEDWHMTGDSPMPDGIAVDRSGDVYVADGRNDRLMKYSDQGTLLARIGRPGYVPGAFKGPAGLAVQPDGAIDVADMENSRVQRLLPDGTGRSVLNLPLTNAPALPTGVAVGPRGELYVIDGLDGTIYRIAPHTRHLERFAAGDRSAGGGPGFDGVAVDGRGNVYAADAGFGTLRKFSPTGRLLAEWNGRNGRLRSPSAVAVDVYGAIYVADTGSDRIVKLSPIGSAIAIWGAGRPSPGRLRRPSGVQLDRHGNVYVADTDANRVVELSALGQVLRTWDEAPNGPVPPAPVDVAARDSGALYVAGSFASVVKIAPDGRLLPSWHRSGAHSLVCPCRLAIDARQDVYVADRYGDGIEVFSSNGTLARTLRVSDPNVLRPHYQGIAVSPDGSIYLTDGSVGVLYRLSSTGHILGRWGEGATVRFGDPQGVAVDTAGDVYVADAGKNRIVRVTANGRDTESIGQSFNLVRPSAVAVNDDGNLYIADAGNNRIVKLAPSARS